MTLKQDIFNTFGPSIFERPVFYSQPGGLRFELSEQGSAIELFLQAIRKATVVCRSLFYGAEPLVVCLQLHSNQRGDFRRIYRALDSAGIRIPAQRESWSEKTHPDDWFSEDEPEYQLYLAFEAPLSLLEPLLWCALASDFQAIRPKPRCAFFLFNLNKRLMVYPYDDRGMDVVGPGRAALGELYEAHRGWLLDYDREAMDATFAPAAGG
ncbi:DUF3885 domain-containing protein [Pseudomonas xanthosomatis]|uniref:DUF3885 domain-containing protein n=1 Tax=Pseudomonas xanthosomatis TaxID=2842356 RepID=UPI001C3CC521|nr:DUF3885 domain-containing protein [Pseudomonas xanthosomatis]QXH48745.1 DUF3885 domain-containing protein [Pseudomonas xanthosomatis]